jgi:hypothetical protein
MAARGNWQAGTVLRNLARDFQSEELKVANELVTLDPPALGNFQPLLQMIATEDVRGAGELIDRLKKHKDPKVREAASRVVAAVPRLFRPEEAIAAMVELGRTPTVDRIRELNPDAKLLGARLLRVLKSDDAAARAAAAQVLGLVGSDVPEVRAALLNLVRTGDEPVRIAAADALDDARSRRIAYTPGILRELRSDDSATRLRAARRAQTLGIDDDAVTGALFRSVSAGDMVAREGLVLGLERAYANQSKALDMLKELAQSTNDPATRAYVRAALRAIEVPAR